ITNGFSVFDIDYRHGGHYSIGELQDQVGELPVGLSVASGNGRHIYVDDGGVLASANTVFGLPGFDVKAKGGVIVAPCSTHRTGNEYRWETMGVPEPLPETWAEALQTGICTRTTFTMPRRNTLPAQFEPGDIFSEGTRNDTLFRFACRERG